MFKSLIKIVLQGLTAQTTKPNRCKTPFECCCTKMTSESSKFPFCWIVDGINNRHHLPIFLVTPFWTALAQTLLVVHSDSYSASYWICPWKETEYSQQWLPIKQFHTDLYLITLQQCQLWRLKPLKFWLFICFHLHLIDGWTDVVHHSYWSQPYWWQCMFSFKSGSI